MKLNQNQTRAITFIIVVLLSAAGVVIQRLQGGLIPVPSWLKDYVVIISIAGYAIVHYLINALTTGDWSWITVPGFTDVKTSISTTYRGANPDQQASLHPEPPAPTPTAASGTAATPALTVEQQPPPPGSLPPTNYPKAGPPPPSIKAPGQR